MHKRPTRTPRTPLRTFDPDGDRFTLGRDFLYALRINFRRHGPRCIKELSEQRPREFIRLVLALLPKEFRRKDVGLFDNMSDNELASALECLKQMGIEKEQKQAEKAAAKAAEAVPPPDAQEPDPAGETAGPGL